MNDNALADTPTRVRALIASSLSVAKTLADGERLEDLGADSPDRVELCVLLEEEFGIDLPYTAEELMDTVGDVIALVTQHLPPPPPPMKEPARNE